MKISKMIIPATVFIFSILLTACERNNTVCPPELDSEKPTLRLTNLLLVTPGPDQSTENIEVEIGKKMILVDKYISGPVCNDDWSGIIYVGCDAQVAEAELDADANPLFFKGCNLDIEPNTVVYVAAHNNEAFYKGCSCHTGKNPIHQ
ncbi:MAG: hypothetical protein ISR59_06895 [Anaerolineales bacterium]|uniref:Uncharacterized protein n=1 Tax=Candidatus Desulfolinea nitratireducens TaxID=2841698 RepID=A0A8J6NNY9_9CHLR|nr:hypothetical protein [Candidatus Desulfolinea nitratireducens]MBL6960820.1 hypothetical protein [Anaerolineales bacterium]